MHQLKDKAIFPHQ